MAEQWPFKPFVEGSSPPELTRSPPVWRAFCLLSVPAGRMLFETPRAHKKSSDEGGLFVLLVLVYFKIIFVESQQIKLTQLVINV